jgi:hypothetical protein
MSSAYFSASALPVPRNAGKQIADANRHLQSYSQKRQQQQRPASAYSTTSTSSFSSRLSTWKQKMHPSKPQQDKLLQPEAVNKAQMHMNF